MNYYIERVCGKCGAPMGVLEVSHQYFDAKPGRAYSEPVDHCEDEHDAVAPMLVKYDVEGVCASCHEY